MTICDLSEPFRTIQDLSGPFRTIPGDSGAFGTIRDISDRPEVDRNIMTAAGHGSESSENDKIPAPTACYWPQAQRVYVPNMFSPKAQMSRGTRNSNCTS